MTDTIPTTRELAEKFKAVLAEWLTEEELAEVVHRNAEDGSEKSETVCHSHDFCDANMAMEEALNSLGVDTDELFADLNDEGNRETPILDLWNGAWTLAKEERFEPKG